MTLNESSLEKKFENATNSQDSIQSLSLWILHHKNHHKRIVQIWMKSFQRAKSSHRLTLFYLANDVIQHAKRKGVPQYLDDFADVLKEATLLVKGDKVCSSIDRVFNIWLERNIYSDEFIDELKSILCGTSVRATVTSKIVAEFKLTELMEKMKRMKKVEQNSMSKLDSLIACKVDATSVEVLNKLKDKTHGEQFSRDFDEATKCLETVINALEKEVAIRSDLVESLEKSEIFYETQKDEAKIVVNAYKNFGLRVKNVKKKLDESKSSLPSPLPSPPRDAPSPTNSDDGPNLPAIDLIPPEVNAFLKNVSIDIDSHQGTSLDQRLSSLIHSIPQFNEQQKVNSNYAANNNQSSVYPQMQSSHNTFPHSDTWNTDHQLMPHAQHDHNMALNYPHEVGFMPPQGTSNPHMSNPRMSDPHMSNPRMSDPHMSNPHMFYDYNYAHHLGESNKQNAADVQQIQALVSSRAEEMNSQMAPIPVPPLASINLSSFSEFPPHPPENFEPADMDLGNSDEEDNSLSRDNSLSNRSQNQRTIKVIDTRRNSSENQSNQHQLKVNNGSYNNMPFLSSSLNSPQLKSIATRTMPTRTPVPHSYSPHSQHASMAPQQQWRPPRSAITAPSHYPSNSLNASGSAHNRNWRPPPNRNNPRKAFRRY